MNKKNSIIFTVILFFSVLGFVWLIVKLNKDPAEEISLEKKLQGNLPKNNSLAATSASASAASAASAPRALASSSQADAASTESQSPPKYPESTPSTDVTADWKTFSSSALGLELKYPEEYVVAEGGNLITLSKNGVDWKIRIYDNKNEKDVRGWFSGHFNADKNNSCAFSDSEIKVVTYESKKVTLNSSGTVTDGKCEDNGIFATNPEKTKIVRIIVGKADAEKDMINKILATFKFN